jgi:hypothetical protein
MLQINDTTELSNCRSVAVVIPIGRKSSKLPPLQLVLLMLVTDRRTIIRTSKNEPVFVDLL